MQGLLTRLAALGLALTVASTMSSCCSPKGQATKHTIRLRKQKPTKLPTKVPAKGPRSLAPANREDSSGAGDADLRRELDAVEASLQRSRRNLIDARRNLERAGLRHRR